MKRSELKQIIKEEVKKAISESPDDPASNLLSLISTSDISKYMDKLSDTINDNDFKVIKNQ